LSYNKLFYLSSDTKCNTDLSYKLQRSSFIGNKVKKLFPPHGIYKAQIIQKLNQSSNQRINKDKYSLKAKQYDDTSVKPHNTPAYSHQQVHPDSTHAQANDAHVLMKQNMMTHLFTPRNTQAYLQTSEQANMRTSEQANMRTSKQANMRTCEQANMHKYW